MFMETSLNIVYFAHSQLILFCLCLLFTSSQAREATWLTDSPAIKFSKLLGGGERDCFAPIKEGCSFPAQVLQSA